MEASPEGRFGRMILRGDDPPVAISLDLFRTPDFVGYGFVVYSRSWEVEPFDGSELRTMTLRFDRDTWDMLNDRLNISEEDLPIEQLPLRHVIEADLDQEVDAEIDEEIYLTAFRPDPELHVVRGFLECDSSSYTFVLEEFGSPDPVILAAIAGLLILGTKILDVIAQQKCFEEARKTCGPGGRVVKLNFEASNEASWEVGGGGTGKGGLKVGHKCIYECAAEEVEPA